MSAVHHILLSMLWLTQQSTTVLITLDSCLNPQIRTDAEEDKEGRKITFEQANIDLFTANVIKESSVEL